MSRRPERWAGTLVDILDVGHGSCVVVRSGDDVALIDAGSGGPILEYLRTEGISRIDTVLISHADADHIGGLSAILSQGIEVARIVWNGDSIKRSAMWFDLVYQLDELEQNDKVIATQNAHDQLSIPVGSSGVEVHVLAPRSLLRNFGAGGDLKDGRAISSNTVSVVAQVLVGGEAVLLVPGDLDSVGFDLLMEGRHRARLKSKYLVLPHHGGLLGTPAQTKAATAGLVTAVEPEMVFVSNGRGRYGNPQPQVIKNIREVRADMTLSCTQLSKACAIREILQQPTSDPYSAGWARGHSCQGSTRLALGNGIGAPLERSRHQTFLELHVPDRLCTE